MYKLALDLYWYCMRYHKLWKKACETAGLVRVCAHGLVMAVLPPAPSALLNTWAVLSSFPQTCCLCLSASFDLTQLPVMQLNFGVITCISGTHFLAFLTITLAASCCLKESRSDFKAATSLNINWLHFLSTLEQASCGSPVNMALFAPGDVPLPHPVVRRWTHSDRWQQSGGDADGGRDRQHV